MKVILALKADDGADIPALAERLRGMGPVEESLELSGGLDLLLRLSGDSLSELKAAVERIKGAEGVRSAESYLVIGERK